MIVFDSATLLLLISGAFGLGSFGSLFLFKQEEVARWWGSVLALVGSILGIILGFRILFSGQLFTWQQDTALPLLQIALHIDLLSAFFVALIGVIASITSFYGLGYLKQYRHHYNVAAYMFFYNLFLLSLFLVVTANQAIYFLMVWELMSLASYCLVVFEHRQRQHIRAGLRYFIMTHCATAFLVVMFMVLRSSAGSFSFADFQAHANALTPGLASLVFILALLGFGTKSGIIPLHIWLPEAHPAAPSSVSAVMSGVMIKTGIFMMIRVFFNFLPVAPFWWGVVVLVVASVSSLLGVLYALTEHDLKRLLAYHSVENIGIILLGVGAALIFRSLGQPELMVLALVAALYHTMNHAIFKSLLFLGAGAVASSTGTRNMEFYGGLIKRMPYTALFFLVGSLAISGIVPFNGFMSEWLTFQSLFAGLGLHNLFQRGSFLVAAGALAFTSGLAAACFVKAFGVTFLARPRSQASAKSLEVGISLRVAMGALATLCLLAGVFPQLVIAGLSNVVQSLTATNIVFPASALVLFPAMGSVFIALLAAILVTLALVYIFSARQKVVVAKTWNCGTPVTPRMEITATAFSRSLITIFRGVLRPTKQSEVEYRDASMRYFATSRNVTLEVSNLYNQYLYKPITSSMTQLSRYTTRLFQGASINTYLLYIFITILGLLVWVTR